MRSHNCTTLHIVCLQFLCEVFVYQSICAQHTIYSVFIINFSHCLSCFACNCSLQVRYLASIWKNRGISHKAYSGVMIVELEFIAHLCGFIRTPLPCPSPCPSPGVFSLCPMDHLTVRTLWYFSRYFSHFSLPRNVLHCEGIEPHTFCFLSLIFDSVACATVQWLSLT